MSHTNTCFGAVATSVLRSTESSLLEFLSVPLLLLHLIASSNLYSHFTEPK